MKYNLSEHNINFLVDYWLANADDVCNYCIYRVDCSTCPDFEEVDMNISGNEWLKEHYPNYKFTCMDFNFADCRRLENTPCKGCVENRMSHFEFNGEEL